MLFCLLVAAIGIAISLLLAQILREQERRLIEVQFQHDAQMRIEAIQEAALDRLNVFDIVAAFYAGSEAVERNEFHTFAEPLMKRYQGVRVLGWAPLIADKERAAHETAVREEGFSNYRITEKDAQETSVPAGKRAEYCPILFAEPFAYFEPLLGCDLRSYRAFRFATKRAIASGRPAATVCSPAGNDPTGSKLLYIVAPIPKKSADAGRSADGLQIAGFVFGIVDINAVVETSLKTFAPVGIDVNIREISDKGRGSLIYSRLSPLHAEGGPADSAMPSDICKPVTDDINVVDRRGEIECVPLESYLSQRRSWAPAAALLTGSFITTLLVGLLFLLTGRTARTRRLVAQRTAELKASEQRFRRLVDNAGDAFFLHDGNGWILDVNKRACESLGYSRDELLLMKISDIDVHFSAGNLSQFWILPDNEYPVTFEGLHLRKDGTTFPVEIRLVPLLQGNNRLMLGLVRDIADRKSADEKLRKEQRLLRDMLDLQEQDRKLVSYEIHDGLAQQLTGSLMKFQALERLIDSDPSVARKMFDDAVRLLREAMVETRRLIGGLRPPILDESGVVPAIEDLIAAYRKNGAPEIEFIRNLEPRRFAPPLESAVFRVVQESLTNACRHSQSEKVRVELGLAEDRVSIDVRDWGIGFDPNNVKHGHFGLRGIRERARLLGGSADIQSSPEQGTRVHVELPLLQPIENGHGSDDRRIPPGHASCDSRGLAAQ